MRSKTRESWANEILPFVAMLITTSSDIGILTIVKAAMNGGMPSIVYIVCHDAIGTLILLPFFIIHILRNPGRPPLSCSILFKFFILGLLGVCLSQVLIIEGTYYSSPIMTSSISNLIPANTFLLAVIFRMERIDIRSSSSLAKLLGTIITISGAMLFTFYQGPTIFNPIPLLDSSNRLLMSQASNWIYGGLLLVMSGIAIAIWNVLQSAMAREYPDQQTIVFFFCLFGTLQCMALSPFMEPNPSAWVLQPGIRLIAVLLGAVFSLAIRNSSITWCLKKKGPVFVAMFNPLQIVISVIMGVTFLGDSLYLGSDVGESQREYQVTFVDGG
ncbi:hypothetical protein E3N88_41874 [Mikania micrantha]|uniref:WAT1-related protein n=1 Tax=Mikania micrantha TaxID=192012 RepID=A0A5N6LJC8_9ASTR|nr:hypothetical protein E3N88_41874 [Mikania micrantha]